MVKGAIVGVLTLYTAKRRKFSVEDIEFLRALADQGGVAIERSRLIDRVRENTAIFHKMAANINASLDVRDILHHLTEALSNAFNMKGVSIRLLSKETG